MSRYVIAGLASVLLLGCSSASVDNESSSSSNEVGSSTSSFAASDSTPAEASSTTPETTVGAPVTEAPATTKAPVTQAPATTKAPVTQAPATTQPAAASGSGLDPRFSSCAKATAAGLGPYYRDEDPEYAWYEDRDGDGIVCEK